jgi:rhodanese-related sulfurtransferase
MKYLKIFILSAITCLSIATSQAQDLQLKKQVWPDKDLMDAKKLSELLDNPRAARPNIYNIGFVGNIEGAKKLNPASKEAGLKQLQLELKDKPKNTPIIIYCGCCPFEHCPNVKPAFALLQKLGYKNAKILNLPTSIKADWIDKGYPMAK